MNRNSIQASDYGTVRCVLSNNFGFQCGSIGPSSEAEAPNHNLLVDPPDFSAIPLSGKSLTYYLAAQARAASANSFAAFAAISGDAIGKAIEDTFASMSWMPSTILVSPISRSGDAIRTHETRHVRSSSQRRLVLLANCEGIALSSRISLASSLPRLNRY